MLRERLGHSGASLTISVGLFLSGCGGSSSPTGATPVITTPASQTTVIYQGTFVDVLPGKTHFVHVIVPRAGTVRSFFGWTFADSYFSRGWYTGECPACTELDVTSITLQGGLDVLTVPIAQPGTYVFMFASGEGRPEAVSLQVTLTTP
jgi:hypothetical protein